MKKTIWITILLLLLSNLSFANDNASSGNGNTSNALDGKGFYRGNEYMYKVSVYVGLSDTTDMYSDLSNFKMIGNAPIFVVPKTFAIPNTLVTGNGSKMYYQNKGKLSSLAFDSVTRIYSDVPPIPITNGGNIHSVKSYFGDTNTLNALINAFADKRGMTRESLVEAMTFTIDGVKGNYAAEDILPIKKNEIYQNKVAWLICYEPVIITYLKPVKGVRNAVAFTATEYALAQKLGYFNWYGGNLGQYVAGMTHSDLPNSIVLEENWVGMKAITPLPDNVYWSDDRIIEGGGIGMRMLKAKGKDVKENDTSYDFSYRVNTEVITSFKVKAVKGDITPDSRHEEIDVRKSAYKNPEDNKAYVTIKALNYTKKIPIVMPQGSQQYAFLKWKTPVQPGEVEVSVDISGNNSLQLENGGRHDVIKVKIEDLSENIPPDPKALDRLENFNKPNLPLEADRESVEWGNYSAIWEDDFKWHEDWHKYHDGCHGEYNEEGKRTGICHHYRWEDEGWWEDYGEWKFSYKKYHASIQGNMKIMPNTKNPTAFLQNNEYTIKSGYGVNIEVAADIKTNAPISHYTRPQNTISYFPEFLYQDYWRLLELTDTRTFEFKKNKYSTFNERVHFTPIHYPDARYEVYSKVIDCWTPAGMLRVNASDFVNIEGSLMDDWHIAPDQ